MTTLSSYRTAVRSNYSTVVFLVFCHRSQTLVEGKKGDSLKQLLQQSHICVKRKLLLERCSHISTLSNIIKP
ncbi:hypothetical protein P171DRAFT_433196 [Karstenula rhodostoma CBS 690.94]|uniref:Uncharacterized protein n=1 Tax=Karstenula rhodostoma CBS 690.94 TaxID=1392251 RepID=A0A9P4PF35_9PLEO|nr:hypothetical protein P171DRAFT_433196 [Karstenula rhodostoma CBS 690.94]